MQRRPINSKNGAIWITGLGGSRWIEWYRRLNPPLLSFAVLFSTREKAKVCVVERYYTHNLY